MTDVKTQFILLVWNITRNILFQIILSVLAFDSVKQESEPNIELIEYN